MGRKYSAVGTGAAGTNKTMLCLNSATTERPAVYDILLGCGATPADLAGRWAVQRYSASGSATSVTPAPLNTSNPASNVTAGKTNTVEPTYTASTEMLLFGLNQRATFRWVAAPGGEIVLPAVAASGIGIYSVSHGGTPTCEATFHWEE